MNVKEEAFYDALVANVLAGAHLAPVVKPPEGVEVSIREGAGKQLLFVINHTEQRQTVPVPAGKTELITGITTSDTLELDIYGVAVIKL